MPITRANVVRAAFNSAADLPYQLRLDDFLLAMQDDYDFFFDVNTGLIADCSGWTIRCGPQLCPACCRTC